MAGEAKEKYLVFLTIQISSKDTPVTQLVGRNARNTESGDYCAHSLQGLRCNGKPDTLGSVTIQINADKYSLRDLG